MDINNNQDLIKLFWTLYNESEPYVANNGKTYVKIVAPGDYGHYIRNMWMRLIPGVKKTFSGNEVIMEVEEIGEKTMKTAEQYYEIYRDFKAMLVERVNVSCMHINNINATCKIADLDKIHAITFMVYAYEYWYAYVMDIIEGNYNYINFTNIVWGGYLEHMSN